MRGKPMSNPLQNTMARNPDAPPNYDYTTKQRSRARNKRQKAAAQRYGFKGIGALATKMLSLSDEQAVRIIAILNEV